MVKKYMVSATVDIVVNVEAEDEDTAIDAAEPFISDAWDAMAEAADRIPGASITDTYDDWEATETA